MNLRENKIGDLGIVRAEKWRRREQRNTSLLYLEGECPSFHRCVLMASMPLVFLPMSISLTDDVILAFVMNWYKKLVAQISIVIVVLVLNYNSLFMNDLD